MSVLKLNLTMTHNKRDVLHIYEFILSSYFEFIEN